MSGAHGDLYRELEKARETLAAVDRHLSAAGEANAALHLSERILANPLSAKVAATLAGVDAALTRHQEPW